MPNSTCLITQDLWPALTAAIRASKRSCDVAVAYFGQGAAKMLPLAKGSRLVVDASERTVKQGMTCPAELSKLQKADVEIYTVPNLHAKVYVTGRGAFVGSPNVSRPSASRLIESLLHTTEKQVVADARQFVQSLCRVSLGPERLKQLAKIYRPPHAPGGKRGKRAVAEQAVAVEMPEVRLAQVSTSADWPDEEEPTRKAGEASAHQEREHRDATHKLDDFRWWGQCGFKKGQQVIKVEEDAGRYWVYPPGYVLHVRKHRGKAVWYVYVEHPVCRRKSLESVIAKLGRGSKAKLRKTGAVRDLKLASELLGLWSR